MYNKGADREVEREYDKTRAAFRRMSEIRRIDMGMTSSPRGAGGPRMGASDGTPTQSDKETHSAVLAAIDSVGKKCQATKMRRREASAILANEGSEVHRRRADNPATGGGVRLHHAQAKEAVAGGTGAQSRSVANATVSVLAATAGRIERSDTSAMVFHCVLRTGGLANGGTARQRRSGVASSAVRVLRDSGATRNFICRRTVDALRLPKVAAVPLRVTLADGSETTAREAVVISLSFEGGDHFAYTEKAYVLDMGAVSDVNVILGTPFLHSLGTYVSNERAGFLIFDSQTKNGATRRVRLEAVRNVGDREATALVLSAADAENDCTLAEEYMEGRRSVLVYPDTLAVLSQATGREAAGGAGTAATGATPLTGELLGTGTRITSAALRTTSGQQVTLVIHHEKPEEMTVCVKAPKSRVVGEHGARVRLALLAADTGLNDRLGVATDFDVKTGRYRVLLRGEAGRVVRVKPANLLVRRGDSLAAVDGSISGHKEASAAAAGAEVDLLARREEMYPFEGLPAWKPAEPPPREADWNHPARQLLKSKLEQPRRAVADVAEAQARIAARVEKGELVDGQTILAGDVGLGELAAEVAERRTRRQAIVKTAKQLASEGATLGVGFWTDTMREKLATHLMDEYADLLLEQLPDSQYFADSGRPMASIRFKEDWNGAAVFRRSPAMSPMEKEVCRASMQEMLDAGVIEESVSMFASPILMVPKPNGSGYRVCVDYRGINKLTVRDRYPLPTVQSILDQLQGMTIFSVLDVLSGFFQIQLLPKHRERSAMASPFGLYQYKVLPMGLVNAPATFQRTMDHVLRGLEHICAAYVDDIVVFSRTEEEHVGHVEMVLQRLRDNRIVPKQSKVQLAKTSVQLLGHTVVGATAERPTCVAPQAEKLATIRDWPVPACVADVRSWLGLASYYRRYVWAFSKKAEPLTALTKGDAVWTWGPEQQESFETLRDHLLSAPLLAVADVEGGRDGSRPFRVDTDASGFSMAGILAQDFGDGFHPVAFASKTFSQAEANWTTTERELRAIVFACCEQFNTYLQGCTYTLRGDHRPLSTLLHPGRQLTPKQARWVQVLQEHNVPDMEWVPGASIPHVDACSRRPDRAPAPCGEASNKESAQDDLLVSDIVSGVLSAQAVHDRLRSHLAKIRAGANEVSSGSKPCPLAELPAIHRKENDIQRQFPEGLSVKHRAGDVHGAPAAVVTGSPQLGYEHAERAPMPLKASKGDEDPSARLAPWDAEPQPLAHRAPLDTASTPGALPVSARGEQAGSVGINFHAYGRGEPGDVDRPNGRLYLLPPPLTVEGPTDGEPDEPSPPPGRIDWYTLSEDEQMASIVGRQHDMLELKQGGEAEKEALDWCEANASWARNEESVMCCGVDAPVISSQYQRAMVATTRRKAGATVPPPPNEGSAEAPPAALQEIGYAEEAHPGPRPAQTASERAHFIERVRGGASSDEFIVKNRAACDAAKYGAHGEFKVANNLLWRTVTGHYQLVIPNDLALQEEVLVLAHDHLAAGHGGRARTAEKVLRRVWWPSASKDIKDYVDSCPQCQRTKRQAGKERGFLRPLKIPQRRFQVLGVDFVTGLEVDKATGFNAVMTITCQLSKFVNLIPMTWKAGGTDATVVAKLFRDHHWRYFGAPLKWVSDRDPRFTSKYWKETCRLLGIEEGMTAAFTPSSNGAAERTNQSMEQVLRAYVHERRQDWAQHLAACQFALNDSVSRSTGFTPAELVFGERVASQMDLYLDAALLQPSNDPRGLAFIKQLQANLEAAKKQLHVHQESMAKSHDARKTESQYKVGDQVLLSAKSITGPADRGTLQKLRPQFYGPFPVLEVIHADNGEPAAYRLQLPAHWTIKDVFNVRRLKAFVGGEAWPSRVDAPAPPSQFVEGQEEHVVERVLGHRWQKKRRGNKTVVEKEYLLRWAGYGPAYDQWVAERNINVGGVNAAWRQYEDEHDTSLRPTQGAARENHSVQAAAAVSSDENMLHASMQSDSLLVDYERDAQRFCRTPGWARPRRQPVNTEPHILVLFGETRSVERAILSRFPNAVLVSVGGNPTYNPTHCVEVVDWTGPVMNGSGAPMHQYAPGYFDVVWGSPGCAKHSRDGHVLSCGQESTDVNVAALLRAIEYLQPRHYFIESPKGLLRARDILLPYRTELHEVSYFLYTAEVTRRRSTDIWTNAVMDRPLRLCSEQSLPDSQMNDLEEYPVPLTLSDTTFGEPFREWTLASGPGTCQMCEVAKLAGDDGCAMCDGIAGAVIWRAFAIDAEHVFSNEPSGEAQDESDHVYIDDGRSEQGGATAPPTSRP